MKEKCPVKGRIAYLASLALRAEYAIFGSGCGSLGALKQHLPGIFLPSVEEPAEGLVLRRIELPQVEGPLLARENPAHEHDLDYVDKLELLVHQGFGHRIEVRSAPPNHPKSVRSLSQEVSRMGVPDQNSGAAAQLVLRGSVM